MTTATAAPSTVRPVLLAALVAAVLGSVGAAVVALVATALGAPDDAQQLQPTAYVPFVVVGVVIGAVGWAVVRRRAAHPRTLLTRLVPATVLVLFVPDVLIAVGGSATWGTAVALMVVHLVVAAAAVGSYLRFLPVHD